MIIEHSKEIINYFSELNLNFSKPQTAHLLDFISAIISCESKKTVSGISRGISKNVHRCNRTRFLNDFPFDDNQFSHVTGKSEFSHCQVAISASTRNLSLPLDLKVYLSKDYCQLMKF